MEDITDLADQIVVSETETVTELLDGTPQHQVVFPNSPTIEFGNTGLRIGFNDNLPNGFDYMPEGKLVLISKDRAKYASMLGVALLSLHTLLNSPDEIQRLGLQNKRLDRIGALTNEDLISAIKGLFARSGDENIVFSIGNEVHINLEKFKELDTDNPMIEYLRKVSERAKNTTVTYNKTIRRQ